jgi:hypothetical protein
MAHWARPHLRDRVGRCGSPASPLLRASPLPRDNSFRLTLFLNSASTGTGALASSPSVFRVAGITAALAKGDGR